MTLRIVAVMDTGRSWLLPVCRMPQCAITGSLPGTGMNLSKRNRPLGTVVFGHDGLAD